MNETSTIKREYDNHTITRVMIYNTMLSRKIGKKKKYGLHFPFSQSWSFHQRHHFHYIRRNVVRRRMKVDQGEIRSRFNNRQEFETREILKRRDVNRRYLINETYCIVHVVCVSPVNQESHVDLTDVALSRIKRSSCSSFHGTSISS